MGPIEYMLYGLAYVAAGVLDLLMLLLGARLLRRRVGWRFVAALDDAARPVVDYLAAKAGGAGSTDRAVRKCLLILLISRLAVSLLAGQITS